MNALASIVVRTIAWSPLFAAYGAFVIARALLAIPRRAWALHRGLATHVTCAAGHAIPMASRWACASCGATYLGTPITCTVCGAGADYVVCDCGLAIRVPWGDRS